MNARAFFRRGCRGVPPAMALCWLTLVTGSGAADIGPGNPAAPCARSPRTVPAVIGTRPRFALQPIRRAPRTTAVIGIRG